MKTFFLIIMVIMLITFGVGIYYYLTNETYDFDCIRFYAKKTCKLNNMELEYIKSPFFDGFKCINTDMSNIEYKEYRVDYNFTKAQINKCTIKPIMKT